MAICRVSSFEREGSGLAAIGVKKSGLAEGAPDRFNAPSKRAANLAGVLAWYNWLRS